jgi:hypothetical protein
MIFDISKHNRMHHDGGLGSTGYPLAQRPSARQQQQQQQ